MLRWHRKGWRLYWTWKSRNRLGRPRLSAEARDLIAMMSGDNPLWGSERIRGELLKHEERPDANGNEGEWQQSPPPITAPEAVMDIRIWFCPPTASGPQSRSLYLPSPSPTRRRSTRRHDAGGRSFPASSNRGCLIRLHEASVEAAGRDWIAHRLASKHSEAGPRATPSWMR